MSLLSRTPREKIGEQKPTRYYSKRQEDTVAKALSGSRTKNSGATKWQKGDVLTDKFLIEAKTKTTPSDSISLRKEWIEKNIQESLFMGKPYSALVFNFGPDQTNYYVIDEFLFQTLLEVLENRDEHA